MDMKESRSEKSRENSPLTTLFTTETKSVPPKISDWRILDSERLWQLFITIKNRVKAAQKRGVSLWHGSDAEPETSENYTF